MPYIYKPKRKQKQDRKQEAQGIYNTRKWRILRELKLMETPICEECQKELATQVHHKLPFMKFQGEQRKMVAYDYDNLESLCAECHTKLHLNNKD